MSTPSAIGCDIVAGSHHLGGSLTGVVKDDLGRCRLRHVVMHSGPDPARTVHCRGLAYLLYDYSRFPALGKQFLGLWS